LTETCLRTDEWSNEELTLRRDEKWTASTRLARIRDVQLRCSSVYRYGYRTLLAACACPPHLKNSGKILA